MASPTPKNDIFRGGWCHHPSLKMHPFLGAVDGVFLGAILLLQYLNPN